MRPSLRRLHSPDLENLAVGLGQLPDESCVPIQAMIGPMGMQGEESFQFSVATPRWIVRQLGEAPYVFGRHLLIVDKLKPAIVEDAITSLCEGMEAEDWVSLARRLAQYGEWEFESYRTKPA